MKPYDEMTMEEQLELGREVDEDPTCQGMMRQGRPLTNVEMHACSTYLRNKRRKAKRFIEDEL